VWQRLAVRHGREFFKHILPAIAKPARSLWNEVIGFIFICFAVVLGFKAFSYLRSGDRGRLIVAGFWFLLMAYFGLASFLRARRISRS
jgi:hypothetical protein